MTPEGRSPGPDNRQNLLLTWGQSYMNITLFIIFLHFLHIHNCNFLACPDLDHFAFLRFLEFGHYLREWKSFGMEGFPSFPVLFWAREQFCGIEVTVGFILTSDTSP